MCNINKNKKIKNYKINVKVEPIPGNMLKINKSIVEREREVATV